MTVQYRLRHLGIVFLFLLFIINPIDSWGKQNKADMQKANNSKAQYEVSSQKDNGQVSKETLLKDISSDIDNYTYEVQKYLKLQSNAKNTWFLIFASLLGILIILNAWILIKLSNVLGARQNNVKSMRQASSSLSEDTQQKTNTRQRQGLSEARNSYENDIQSLKKELELAKKKIKELEQNKEQNTIIKTEQDSLLQKVFYIKGIPASDSGDLMSTNTGDSYFEVYKDGTLTISNNPSEDIITSLSRADGARIYLIDGGYGNKLRIKQHGKVQILREGREWCLVEPLRLERCE